MFKGVDTSRPWPDQGMTTTKWMELPTNWQYIPLLIATQRGVYFEPLIARDEPVSYSGDPFPHVIHWRDEHYLEDGHTRVMRAALRGQSLIRVRTLVIDD